MNREKAEILIRRGIGALGLVFLAVAVNSWFTGGQSCHVLGMKISLHEWQKPWWIGVSLMVLSFMASPDPGRAVLGVAGLVRRGFVLVGVDLERMGMLWAAWGLFVGAFAGVLFSIHYYYLVTWFGLRVIVVACAAVMSAGLHSAYYQMIEMGFSAVPGFSSSGRRGSLRLAIYLLIWGALIGWPLRFWEARLTEPIWRQGLFAAGVGLLLTWLLMAKRRLSGVAGKARAMAAAGLMVTVLAASAWSWWSESSRDDPDSPPRDRVVFITIDTVRADHLSCYGYARKTSPNLDALAATGVRFTRAFCPMGVTDPSHASMLTGVYPRTHGVQDPFQVDSTLPAGVASIVEVFRDRGFVTGAMTSRVFFSPARLGVPGFDYASGPSLVNTSAREAVRRALNWSVRNRDRNSFLWVHFFDPHQPYEPHPGAPIKFISRDLGPRSGDKWLNPGKFYSEEEVKYMIDLYDGEIAYMDMWIGRLLKKIEEMDPKSERPPLVIVLADHGEMLDELQHRPIHFAFGHGGPLYNGVAHIPLIMSWPGQIPEGTARDNVAEVVDLAPTLVDYFFERVEFPSQGRSLRPVIEKNAPDDDPGYLERRRFAIPPQPFLAKKQYVMIKWPYKLFYTVDGDVELYDLDSDRDENQDISADNQEEAGDMVSGIEDWLERTPRYKNGERALSPGEIERLRGLGYIQ